LRNLSALPKQTCSPPALGRQSKTARGGDYTSTTTDGKARALRRNGLKISYNSKSPSPPFSTRRRASLPAPPISSAAPARPTASPRLQGRRLAPTVAIQRSTLSLSANVSRQRQALQSAFADDPDTQATQSSSPQTRRFSTSDARLQVTGCAYLQAARVFLCKLLLTS
jgi:hypothetical protein